VRTLQAPTELLNLITQRSGLLSEMLNAKEPLVSLRPMCIGHVKQIRHGAAWLLSLDSTGAGVLNACGHS
jgi:hypothetical protein